MRGRDVPWDKIKSAAVTAVVLALIWTWLTFSVNQTSERTTDLRNELVRSCERVNDLREETNDVIAGLQDFLLSAAAAREASGDQSVADEYRRIATTVEPVELTDCQNDVRPV